MAAILNMKHAGLFCRGTDTAEQISTQTEKYEETERPCHFQKLW